MARGLIPKANELVCAPGTRVYVERTGRSGEPESFEDTISCVHIEVYENCWKADYFFTDADDGAEAEHIKRIIAAPRSYNPLPTPRYEIGDVLEYIHSWGKNQEVMIDKVHHIEIIWYPVGSENWVRYVVKGYGRDWIDEPDVIAQYIKKENTCESSPQNSEKRS